MYSDKHLSKSEYYYTITIALIPLLNVYGFVFIPGISLGMIITSIFAVVGFVSLISNFKISATSFPFMCLLFSWSLFGSISFFIPSSIGSDFFLYFYNLLKLLVWGILILSSYKYLNTSFLIRVVIFVSCLATAYIFIQAIMAYILGVTINNGFNFGIIVANYSDYNYSQDVSDGQVRLASFWFEPAQYGSYIILSLICLYFKDDLKIKRRIEKIIFLSCGLIISTSSAAIFWMLIIFFIWLLWRGYITVISTTVFLISIFYLSIYFDDVLVFLQGQGVLGYSIYLALTKLQYWESSARLGASYKTAFELFNLYYYKYTGIGIGSEKALMQSMGLELLYLNSFSRVFIWSGFIGVISYVVFYLFMTVKFIKFKLPIVLLTYCFISGLYSTMWTSPESILYYSLSFCLLSQKLNDNKTKAIK
jgi:hypothetical protein